MLRDTVSRIDNRILSFTRGVVGISCVCLEFLLTENTHLYLSILFLYLLSIQRVLNSIDSFIYKYQSIFCYIFVVFYKFGIIISE